MLFLTRKFRKQLFRDLEFLRKRIVALEARNGETQAELASVKAALGSSDTTLDQQIKSGISLLQQQINCAAATLEEQAAAARNEIAVLEKQADSIKSGVAGIERQFEITRSGVASIEQHAASIKSGVASIEQQIEKTRSGDAERSATARLHAESDEERQKPLLQIVSEQIRNSHEQLATLIQARSTSDLSNADNYETLNPEIGLIGHLYSFLPNRTCVDIGANLGEFSARLLQVGYKVYAFEPFPEAFRGLSKRFEQTSDFHGFPCAIGATDTKRKLHVVADHTGGKYEDPTVYNTLAPHPLVAGLSFAGEVEVPVRSLASLHESGDLPADVGIVKIDTEGYDLEVIQGMGLHRYPVVSAEFWDSEYVFGHSDARNQLDHLATAMKTRGYHWFIVLYRIDDPADVSFYCHRKQSVKRSWGNVFFFTEYSLFRTALEWCSAVLPETRFR